MCAAVTPWSRQGRVYLLADTCPFHHIFDNLTGPTILGEDNNLLFHDASYDNTFVSPRCSETLTNYVKAPHPYIVSVIPIKSQPSFEARSILKTQNC